MTPEQARRIMCLPGWVWRRLPNCVQQYVIDAWLAQYPSLRRLS